MPPIMERADASHTVSVVHAVDLAGFDAPPINRKEMTRPNIAEVRGITARGMTRPYPSFVNTVGVKIRV